MEEKFKAAIETKEVLQRIQDRLVIERAQMENEVEAKIAEERRVQLQSRRKEQEQRLKDQVQPSTSLHCSEHCDWCSVHHQLVLESVTSMFSLAGRA